MNAANARNRDRLDELLADEAAAALEAGDAPELEALLADNPAVARDELLEIAALTQVAFLRGSRMRSGSPAVSELPAGLRARLAGQDMASRRMRL